MSNKNDEKEVAPRPGQQPQASGNSGQSVTVPKKENLPPADQVDDVDTLKEMVKGLTARIEQMERKKTGPGSSPSNSKIWGGKRVKMKVLCPIRLPRNYALGPDEKRTPRVGSIIEVPEELAELFTEKSFDGQFDFSGERFKPEKPGEVSQITRHKYVRAVIVTDEKEGPDPVPQAVLDRGQSA